MGQLQIGRADCNGWSGGDTKAAVRPWAQEQTYGLFRLGGSLWGKCVVHTAALRSRRVTRRRWCCCTRGHTRSAWRVCSAEPPWLRKISSSIGSTDSRPIVCRR
eukprot:3653980-Pyramimonas_sp.AAC.1